MLRPCPWTPPEGGAATGADSVLLLHLSRGPVLLLALTDPQNDDDSQDRGGDLDELGDDQEQGGQAEAEPCGRILEEAPESRIQHRGEDEQAPPPGEPGWRMPWPHRGVRLRSAGAPDLSDDE